MVKVKIPKNWSEKDCYEAINKLFKEYKSLVSKKRFDDATKCLLKAAQITHGIPTVIRKTPAKKFKKKEDEKEDPIKEDDLSPFNVENDE